MNPGRSLRIVLACVGSRGDVQPMLALALALAQVLAARGHVPVVAAPANICNCCRATASVQWTGTNHAAYRSDGPEQRLR